MTKVTDMIGRDKILRIAILSSSQDHMESIRKMLLETSPGRRIRLFKDDLGKASTVADQDAPDLIILDGMTGELAELADLERMVQRYPGVALIALCEKVSSEFLISAMRVGVRDVLPLPVVPQALLDAVTRVEQRLESSTSRPQLLGKVLAFIACKGGSGATFLASNIGYILAAKEEGAKVVLLDLNLQFGDAALFVSDHVPANTVADVTDNIARLDASFLASSMIQVLPNYCVLAAPEDPERAVDVTPEHVEVLLNLARASYDYIILDIGRILNATSVKALDQADLIFPVLQELLPFIRDSKRLIHTLLSLGYPKEKIRPIVNRYVRGGDIQLDDVESALGLKVFKTIPNSYEAVSKSVNQGVPVFKIARHDPVTKALEEMVHELTEVPQARKAGWLSHLFHSA